MTLAELEALEKAACGINYVGDPSVQAYLFALREVAPDMIRAIREAKAYIEHAMETTGDIGIFEWEREDRVREQELDAALAPFFPEEP